MFLLKKVKYKHILDIQHLSIRENKITCIVGESGSGKTILLRLLNKLISCDSGEIYYKEQELSSIYSIDLRRKIVMLPQQAAIFPGNIRDNLLIGLKFAEQPIVHDSELQHTLKMVHLKNKLDDPSETLSGGEKQRLALGRIILMKPEVFLLDEPSSALDDETERIIIEQLVAYTKENQKSLIMVTHSRNIAQTYADDIIEIHNGTIAHFQEVSDERYH
ncbi:MAG: ABC transporter ATP-binding protein [Eubacteriaceae bacterium]|nr:ABC transporter ATP-binding protein [Eubacteriaceae bacterium]